MDAITLQVIKDGFTAIGQEMFQVMLRTSMSPIIYETTDFAVGLTDAEGSLLAQGNGVSAFLATLDTAAQSTLEHYPAGQLHPGDVIITNTPYEGGGTHLSDVVIVLPIFWEGTLIAFCVNKSHWTEIGGANAGSVSTTSTDIFQEGLHFRFLKLYERGVLNQALVSLIETNVRLPQQTLGDMHAGVAAARMGERRIHELLERYGAATVRAAMEHLLDYGERMTRHELLQLPEGEYEAHDVIEEDGLGGGPFPLHVKVTVRGGKLIADFTGTSLQARGPINSSRTGLVTAVRCALKAITNPALPANGGCFRPLEIICPEGTLLTAASPAPVSIYYESLVACIELVWRALAPVIPDRLPAGHYRSVCGTFLAGTHPQTKELFVLGEPLVGGWGATADRDGLNGLFCCANGETYNIPVELAERRYGVLIEQYAYTQDGGGAGKFRGGRGVVLDYRITAPDAALTVTYTRTKTRPWGLAGGQPGTPNRCEIIRVDGTRESATMTTALALQPGDLVRITTGTGGGYGPPQERDPKLVAADVRNGFVGKEEAARVYGVAR